MRRALLPLLLLAAPLRAAAPDLPAEASLYRPDDTTLVLRWHADSGAQGSVEMLQGGAKVSIPARNVGNDYHATLSDLPPNSEVRFTLRPYGRQDVSREHVYYTRPPAGMLETRTLPLLVVVYTPIHYTDAPKDDAALPPHTPKRLTVDDISALRRQLEDVRDFYFRATHGRLNLVWEIVTMDKSVGNRPALEVAGELSKTFEKDVDALMAAREEEFERDYAGALFLYGWSDGLSQEARSRLYRGQAFSGGTYGHNGPWRYKKNPYSLINFNRGADTRWTVTHEFGHQLDSMADYSGYPSLAFNHPDPMTAVGVFGEHWDANRWLLSKFPRQNWIGMKYGHRHLSADADTDGLADDDPFLPMDEKRFGSDPARSDTDGDGLSDLEEYSATLGITHGLNERMASPRVAVDPRNPDSDGDGIPDGADPYPAIPVQTARRRVTPRVDGVWREGEWQPAGEIRVREAGQDISATFGLQWDDQFLYVALRANRPLDLCVDLDANNDGWFAGGDNYRLTFAAPQEKPAKPVITSIIWDWTVFDHTREPNPYLNQSKDIVKPEDLFAAVGSEESAYVIEAAIPFNYKTNLRLYDGKRLGVKLAARLPGTRDLLTVFEPHTLMEMQLRGTY